jgi:glycosyltransferase involved in cell wall biosynthesis
MSAAMSEPVWIEQIPSTDADVCILVEGAYPYVPGGVSGWIDWLIRSQPETTFSVVSLMPRPGHHKPRFQCPPNVVGFSNVYLQDFGAKPSKRLAVPPATDALADALSALTTTGGQAALSEVLARIGDMRERHGLPVLFNSPIAWRIVERMYETDMPSASFLHYFWGWRALLGGLFACLETPLQPARIYHTISTGYAGILAARATLETRRPAILTEHGIYTNERRIELLMADWVADTVDKGHALDDPRFDLRDMWVRAFEAYARTCYEASAEVTTLYGDNQKIQQALGADAGKLTVIANGINLERFAGIPKAPADTPPSIALIGRVVPIKDVKTYIRAARRLKLKFPALKAYIIGPTDEDATYADECYALVAALGLEDTVEFTGAVNIVDYLGRIHVVVLTSLSESQPLVVLEAGAAGLPFVATNVGSCREILEGRGDEIPPLGRGGLITNVVDDAAIAEAVGRLLDDEELRHTYGQAIKARVETVYTSPKSAAAYRALYDRHSLPPVPVPLTTGGGKIVSEPGQHPRPQAPIETVGVAAIAGKV